ncbi:MAG: hypothetical protein ACRDRF_07065, partial [Pseudonocardiaceae bacterium]
GRTDAPYRGTADANIVCATDSCVPALWQVSPSARSSFKALNADADPDLAFPQLPQSVSAQEARQSVRLLRSSHAHREPQRRRAIRSIASPP